MGAASKKKRGRALVKAALALIDVEDINRAFAYLHEWAPVRVLPIAVGHENTPAMREKLRARAVEVLKDGGFHGYDVRVRPMDLALQVTVDKAKARELLQRAGAERGEEQLVAEMLALN